MQSRDGRRASLALAFAGMGVTASVIPAVLPSVADDSGLPLSDYLDVIPGLFGGLFLGVLLSTLVARFWSAHVILTVGASLQFVGFAMVAASGSPIQFVGASVVTGLGFGLAEASASVLAKAVAIQRTASLLVALTGTVAAVAAICPIVLAGLLADGNPRLIIAATSLIHVLSAVLVIANRSSFRGDASPTPPSTPAAVPPRARLVRTILLTGFALFLYVGVETVFSGWSAVLAIGLLNLDTATAALGTSAFWAFMAVGRYLAWIVLKTKLAPAAYLMMNCGVATLVLAASAIVAPDGGPLSAIGVCVTVVCLAPCYSLILGMGLDRMELKDAARTTGLLVAAGAAGGSAIPLLILAVSPEPAGQLVIAATASLMFALSLLVLLPLVRRTRGRGAEQPLPVGVSEG